MIRVLRPEDITVLKEMFDKQHFDGEELIDVEDLGAVGDGMVSKLVYCDKKGRPRIALLARLTAEVMLFGDPEWETPQERLRAGLELEEFLCADLEAKGIDYVLAAIPLASAKSFGKRIREVGWIPHHDILFRKDLTNGQKGI